jgi:hypothetical protein
MFFSVGIFTLWEYVVIDSLFIIKNTEKLGFLKRAKRRISPYLCLLATIFYFDGSL